MNDLISRQAAIDALRRAEALTRAFGYHNVIDTIRELPSAQPEYYDYSDIEPLWKSFAEENDINLTSTAKQLKDAMWVGYRKGKQDAQPDIIRCKDCKWWDKYGENHGYCMRVRRWGEYFCADAERREE